MHWVLQNIMKIIAEILTFARAEQIQHEIIFTVHSYSEGLDGKLYAFLDCQWELWGILETVGKADWGGAGLGLRERKWGRGQIYTLRRRILTPKYLLRNLQHLLFD